MTASADIRAKFDVTPLQWKRAEAKACKRCRRKHAEPGLVLMIYLTEMRDLTVDAAFAEIERVTGERPMPRPQTQSPLGSSLWK